MNKTKAQYGLFKEKNGTYSLIEPSDCADKGGQYLTKFDKNGRFLYTSVPWQVGDRSQDLTPREMKTAN